MKPILFNTDMVKAILEGRKTFTRRAAFPEKDLREFPRPNNPDAWWYRGREYRSFRDAFIDCKSKCKYRKGDILYVRETWGLYHQEPNFYVYKADSTPGDEFDRDPGWKWRPAIHMPKEAARIFLRIKTIQLNRLRDMVLADVLCEGITEAEDYYETWDRWHAAWDSTIPLADRDRYGWAADPWVWVISFEQCEKPEAG